MPYTLITCYPKWIIEINHGQLSLRRFLQPVLIK